MPAPIKNRNAVRHGLRAGQLPKGASYIKRETDVLRRIIEDAVAALDGGNVSLYHAGVVQSCIRWERHAMLCQRWLRLEAGDLTPDQRLAFSRDIARASTERDKCLRELGLNVKPNSDPWAALDVRPVITNGSDEPPASAQGDDVEPDDESDDETPVRDTDDSRNDSGLATSGDTS